MTRTPDPTMEEIISLGERIFEFQRNNVLPQFIPSTFDRAKEAERQGRKDAEVAVNRWEEEGKL